MGRRGAWGLHLGLSLLAVVLYAVFVIPRWWVLTGDIPTTAATVGRIAAGLPIAAAAVPVALLLRRAMQPDQSVPELALRLRAWSGVLHVVAGVLIVLTAVAEIWLPMTTAGPWLFAVYGAAGAIAILAMTAFWLSLRAERPLPEPKPAKARKPKKVRRKKAATAAGDSAADATADTEAGDTDADGTEAVEAEAVGSEAVDGEVVASESADATNDVQAETTDESDADVTKTPDSDESAGVLRNKRPTGKRRHRLRR